LINLRVDIITGPGSRTFNVATLRKLPLRHHVRLLSIAEVWQSVHAAAHHLVLGQRGEAAVGQPADRLDFLQRNAFFVFHGSYLYWFDGRGSRLGRRCGRGGCFKVGQRVSAGCRLVAAEVHRQRPCLQICLLLTAAA